MDTNDDWIVQRTGIVSRKFSDYDTSKMAYKAALDAISNAKINKNDIELIVVCTFTPDYLSPSVANLVAKSLDLENDVPGFDLNAGCTGFLYGLKVVQAMIESNMYQTILLIGAENISKLLDFDDRSTAILFGDGAAATILQASEHGVIKTNVFNRDDTKEAIIVGNGIDVKTPFSGDSIVKDKAAIHMKGQEVFKFATSITTRLLKEFLKDNDLSIDDIKYIIPHQANLRIIEYMIKSLRVAKEKFVISLENVGNTSAASIPIALDELNKEGKLNEKDKVIFIGFGSGLTYGISLIEW
jgi:3-oxoacyl-[acyl-carrier-protein] synthase-3